MKHIPVHIVRDNAICLQYSVCNSMLNILAKGMHVHGGDACMY